MDEYEAVTVIKHDDGRIEVTGATKWIGITPELLTELLPWHFSGDGLLVLDPPEDGGQGVYRYRPVRFSRERIGVLVMERVRT